MLSIDCNLGIVEQAQFIASPNFDARPERSEINLLVIHNISLPPSDFGGSGIIELFTNTLDPKQHPYYEEIKDLRVSSHFLIRRDGELFQFVSLLDRAWHAGKSEFAGRTCCNDFSIGIELEGTDDLAYEDAQYQTLINLTQLLMKVYPGIGLNRIVGHCDIAPDRKTDPGESFDWSRFKTAIRENV